MKSINKVKSLLVLCAFVMLELMMWVNHSQSLLMAIFSRMIDVLM